MPVYPVEWLPIRAGAKYPHMSKHDSAIWDRFLDAYGGEFDAVCYDVALGGRVTMDPEATEAERLGWQYDTAKKIDAAVAAPEEVWICEVRPSAGLAAVGSVLGYAILSDVDKWTDKALVMTIVTDNMDDDTKLVCQELEIQVLELPEPRPTEADLGNLPQLEVNLDDVLRERP